MRRVLAGPPAGAEIARSGGGEEYRADHHDANVAAEDQDGDAARDEPLVHEHEKERAEQQLVRNGIEIFAQSRALVQNAREQAVEAIADAGQDEESKCHAVPAVQHGCDQEWNDA